jgi:hypothetical protein
MFAASRTGHDLLSIYIYMFISVSGTHFCYRLTELRGPVLYYYYYYFVFRC